MWIKNEHLNHHIRCDACGCETTPAERCEHEYLCAPCLSTLETISTQEDQS